MVQLNQSINLNFGAKNQMNKYKKKTLEEFQTTATKKKCLIVTSNDQNSFLFNDMLQKYGKEEKSLETYSKNDDVNCAKIVKVQEKIIGKSKRIKKNSTDVKQDKNNQAECNDQNSSDQQINVKDESNCKTESNIEIKNDSKWLLNLDSNMILNNLQNAFDGELEQINHRNNEQATINQFILNCLEQKYTQRCLLISGTPGCGKTSLVNKQIKDLQIQSKQKICIIQKNAMNFTSFSIMFEQILEEYASFQNISYEKKLIGLNQLNQVIKQKKCKYPTILIIDEFDTIFKSMQYDALDIFSLANNKDKDFILIGISNSMELVFKLGEKEKTNLSKVQNLIFQSYNKEQLLSILQQRLKEFEKKFNLLKEIFNEFSLKLLVSKVYSVKGSDVRSIFEVCKKALQLKLSSIEQLQENNADHDNLELNYQITWADLQKTYNQLYNSSKMQNLIDELPEYQQMVLCSICKLMKKKTVKEFKFPELLTLHQTICKFQKLPSQDQSSLKDIISILANYNIINIPTASTKDKGNYDKKIIILKFNLDEIIQILSKNNIFKNILDEQ